MTLYHFEYLVDDQIHVEAFEVKETETVYLSCSSLWTKFGKYMLKADMDKLLSAKDLDSDIIYHMYSSRSDIEWFVGKIIERYEAESKALKSFIELEKKLIRSLKKKLGG